MRRQISGKPDGSNPLIYTGSVPNMVTMPRRPTIQDGINWPLGYWWVIPKDDTFTTGEIWILVSVANAIATWKKLHGGGGPTPPTNTLLVNKIYLTTPGAGTYTPTTGMVQCYVECVGGGGSGNTVNVSWALNWFTNAPGGGGGYCAKLYTASDIGSSVSYVVGAGGLAPTADATADGVDGGDTTFLGMTAGGGKKAEYEASGYSNVDKGRGGSASGGDINILGGDAIYSSLSTGAGVFHTFSTLKAGDSFYGKGPGAKRESSSGVQAQSGEFGSGGGAFSYNSGGGSGLVIGGNGGDGLIIITEYLA